MAEPPSPLAEAASFARALERVAPILELVERTMREQLESESEVVVSLGDHVLASGGKRVRPALLLLCAELCGYTGPRRIQIAAAVELLHTATLLHDDVVDFSRMRRGRPSAMALWGNRRAVLAGDFFYARASSMIIEDGDLEVLWVFSNTIRRMAEGEILQLQRSFDPEMTEAQYYAVIERKSAALLAAACEGGAILGGVTRAERRLLAEFGRELGLAFQIRDDALDYEAGSEVLGKPRYADLREGKVTLPLLLALKRCTPAERAAVAARLKGAHEAGGDGRPLEEDELAPALEIVARYRGISDSVRRAEEHVARAQAAVDSFAETPAKDALRAAAAFAVARDR
jgi:octaprenyl-diphosphate synthase